MKTRSKEGEVVNELTNHFYTRGSNCPARTANLKKSRAQRSRPSQVALFAASSHRDTTHDRLEFMLGADEDGYGSPRKPWWFMVQQQARAVLRRRQLIAPLARVYRWLKQVDGNHFEGGWQPESALMLAEEYLWRICCLLKEPLGNWAAVEMQHLQHPFNRCHRKYWPLLYPVKVRRRVDGTTGWSWGSCMEYCDIKVQGSRNASTVQGYLQICVGHRVEAKSYARPSLRSRAPCDQHGTRQFIEHKGICVTAHRLLAWAMYGPPKESGMVVVHTCENRRCLHPAHIVYATQSQNLELANVRNYAARQRVLQELIDKQNTYVSTFPVYMPSFKPEEAPAV